MHALTPAPLRAGAAGRDCAESVRSCALRRLLGRDAQVDSHAPAACRHGLHALQILPCHQRATSDDIAEQPRVRNWQRKRARPQLDAPRIARAVPQSRAAHSTAAMRIPDTGSDAARSGAAVSGAALVSAGLQRLDRAGVAPQTLRLTFGLRSSGSWSDVGVASALRRSQASCCWRLQQRSTALRFCSQAVHHRQQAAHSASSLRASCRSCSRCHS